MARSAFGNIINSFFFPHEFGKLRALVLALDTYYTMLNNLQI